MRELSHTPGPWHCEPDQHFGPGFVITAPGMGNRCPVVRMSSPLGEHDETLKADARLIAAAPEMLAALRGITSNAALDEVQLAPVRSAIAKAIGLAATAKVNPVACDDITKVCRSPIACGAAGSCRDASCNATSLVPAETPPNATSTGSEHPTLKHARAC